MKDLNLTLEEVKSMTKRKVVSRFTGWKMKNLQDIREFAEGNNIPELLLNKPYDIWLLMNALHELDIQVKTHDTPQILIDDTEKYLQSLVPIALSLDSSNNIMISRKVTNEQD